MSRQGHGGTLRQRNRCGRRRGEPGGRRRGERRGQHRRGIDGHDAQGDLGPHVAAPGKPGDRIGPGQAGGLRAPRPGRAQRRRVHERGWRHSPRGPRRVHRREQPRDIPRGPPGGAPRQEEQGVRPRRRARRAGEPDPVRRLRDHRRGASQGPGRDAQADEPRAAVPVLAVPERERGHLRGPEPELRAHRRGEGTAGRRRGTARGEHPGRQSVQHAAVHERAGSPPRERQGRLPHEQDGPHPGGSVEGLPRGRDAHHRDARAGRAPQPAEEGHGRQGACARHRRPVRGHRKRGRERRPRSGGVRRAGDGAHGGDDAHARHGRRHAHAGRRDTHARQRHAHARRLRRLDPVPHRRVRRHLEARRVHRPRRRGRRWRLHEHVRRLVVGGARGRIRRQHRRRHRSRERGRLGRRLVGQPLRERGVGNRPGRRRGGGGVSRLRRLESRVVVRVGHGRYGHERQARGSVRRPLGHGEHHRGRERRAGRGLVHGAGMCHSQIDAAECRHTGGSGGQRGARRDRRRRESEGTQWRRHHGRAGRARHGSGHWGRRSGSRGGAGLH
mmetsp:Transcript_3603/g.8061  ORF Transcript_3603/g.8061 Transcript_3603/m.8061 type:complete len:557 (-) Transcript_3603:135-1805(-)